MELILIIHGPQCQRTTGAETFLSPKQVPALQWVILVPWSKWVYVAGFDRFLPVWK
jgi:hypothetical protein